MKRPTKSVMGFVPLAFTLAWGVVFVASARPRPPLPPTPPDRTVRLELRFDTRPWSETASWVALSAVNVEPVESWSGWAASLSTTSAVLRVSGQDVHGRPTLDP